ncbi:VOC family protein [Flavobacterium soyae]|uniref:VOC family protein n=1 Tax=Flavobacterium soyae TaxID=2903098 RepID=A0ABZ2UFD4_9FLAO
MKAKRNIGGWFEIYVEDMERAMNFYQYVFDDVNFNDLTKENGQMQLFEWEDHFSGAGGALVKMEFNKPSPNGTIIYFNCDDCAVQEARAREKGVKILVPKTPLPHFGFSALLRDSENNTIGLYSLK